MKLSRTIAYAIQATIELGAAGPNAVVASRKLAEAGGIPDRFLLQILRNLVAHGILKSTRGVVGGYTLNRDIQEISLLDIIEAIEGPVTLDIPLSSPNHEALHLALSSTTLGVRRELSSLTLDQLLAKPAA
ncbi:MAG: Rrf2 family transcriptional regulator [Pirellulales bacterium]